MKAQDFCIRPARREDGAAIWRLVRESETLELNSCYAYLLLASHFADTCVVCVQSGDLLGAVLGYRLPQDPATVFVWQIGVARKARQRGIGKAMVHALLDAVRCQGVTHLEATINPSNGASDSLFRGIARDFATHCNVRDGFVGDDFGPMCDHEPERLYRIGPLDHAVRNQGDESC